MSKAVVCVASSMTQADGIVAELRRVGFPDADISVLLPDPNSARDIAHEKHTKAPEGAATGATTGGIVGGALGLLAGVGLLAIPGVGPFIAAGPIMAALGGMGAGAAVGGITGALIGLGIPELEAKRYEDKVKNGNILISAHAENGDEVKIAKQIFKDGGATDISSTGEKAAPNPSKPATPSQSPDVPASRY